MDNLDPNFQSDQQSKRTPLHAAAQKGSVEICHVLLQVSAPGPSASQTASWIPSPGQPLPGASPRAPLLAGWSQHQRSGQAAADAADGGCGEQPPGGGSLHGAARRLRLQQGVRHGRPGPSSRTRVEVPARGLICPHLPQEEDGSTCLHHAAKIGNLEMVSLLLSTGQVDVNAQVSGLTSRQASYSPWLSLGPGPLCPGSDLWPFPCISPCSSLPPPPLSLHLYFSSLFSVFSLSLSMFKMSHCLHLCNCPMRFPYY